MFLNVGTTGIWSWLILGCGGAGSCCVHCKVFGGFLGLCPLDAKFTGVFPMEEVHLPPHPENHQFRETLFPGPKTMFKHFHGVQCRGGVDAGVSVLEQSVQVTVSPVVPKLWAQHFHRHSFCVERTLFA